MPFDPSGNFSRMHSWQQDRDNGIRILADRHDEEDDNFGNAFNLTFLRTGTVPMTGNLVMGGNAIKLIKAGSEAAPGLSFELSNQTGIWQPNPTTIAVSSNGVKKFEVNGTGIGVFGDTTFNGAVGITGNLSVNGLNVTTDVALGGLLYAGNSIIMRDDAANDKSMYLIFRDHAAATDYASIGVTAAGDMNFSVAGAGNAVFYNPISCSSTLWIGGTSGFVGNVTMSNALAVNGTIGTNSTLSAVGQIYGASTMHIIGDATLDGVTSMNNASCTTLWSNAQTTNSLHNWGPSNLDGTVTCASNLQATGQIKSSADLWAGTDIHSERDISCNRDIWANTGSAHLGYVGCNGLDNQGAMYCRDNITIYDRANDKESYINFQNSDGSNPWGNIGIKGNNNLGLWSQYGNIEMVSGLQCNQAAHILGALTVDGNGYFNNYMAVTAASSNVAIDVRDTASNAGNGTIRFVDNGVTRQYGLIGYQNGALAINNTNSNIIAMQINSVSMLTIEAAGPTRIGNDPWNNNASGWLKVQPQAAGGIAIGCDSIGMGDYYPHQFLWNHTGVGSIHCTGVGTQFFTTSDGDLKDNITDAEDAGELLDRVKVRQFDWIGHDVHQRYGTVAQELLEVFPEAINKSDEMPYMVDYSCMVPMLIKVLQETRARVEYLEKANRGRH